MLYRLAADVVMFIHLLFVLFVVLGGFLSLRFRWMPWVHLPVAIYGAMIEFIGFYCPLTPLENWLRRRGGQAGYDGGFVETYILHILYPDGLTRRVEIAIGMFVIAINVVAYWLFVRKQG
ncbi:MAG: DUF2784 domain-containing protein [Acidobacteria bacterium]|nr:DUF2784 domain-containing protein [Acidobacteriota bacterium]